MKIIKSIAFVGESHCGSEYALWPEPRNEAQKRLLFYWEDFWRKCDDANVDIIVWMGEYVDGANVAGFGKGQITTDLKIQKEAITTLLGPHIKDRKLRAVTGSDYHVRAVTANIDEDITEDKLGGKHKGFICNLRFPPSDKIFNIAHDISLATVYKSTPVNKEMVFSQAAQGLKLLPVDHYDIIVRGHIHDFFYIHDRRMHGFTTPCWKCYHPIKGRTRYHARQIPAIGGVIVYITDHDRIIVEEHLYPTPHVLGGLEEISNGG